jgi:hypothetical protein
MTPATRAKGHSRVTIAAMRALLAGGDRRDLARSAEVRAMVERTPVRALRSI